MLDVLDDMRAGCPGQLPLLGISREPDSDKLAGGATFMNRIVRGKLRTYGFNR
jgi:hypothetical protein